MITKLPSHWINREISWLSFNERVLQEAEDTNNPLIERMRFLGIFSNNRDEFFRVRVAAAIRLTELVKSEKSFLQEDPDKIMADIQKSVLKQQKKFDEIHQSLREELALHNVNFVNEKQINKAHSQFVKAYFNENVRTALVPIIIKTNSKFPFLKDAANYLLVKLFNKHSSKTKNTQLALIEIPSVEIPRLLELPSIGRQKYLILLDDIIRNSLPEVFAFFNYDTIDAYSIKLTRDAELDIDEDISKSVVDKLSSSVKNRQIGDPVRFVYDSKIPKELLQFVLKKLKLEENDNIIPGGRYHNFKDFIDFPLIGSTKLRNIDIPSQVVKEFVGKPSIIDVIKKQDILLFYPYQEFDYLIDFLREAAIDPNVVDIKINLYRVAKRSKIINALVNALKNGKSVTVLVELRARFDEKNNITWADKLQEQGVRVIFGLPGLKVHSKLIVITRKEGKSENKYAHIGTGNFNEKTAYLYSDISLFTADVKIANEVDKVFDFIERPYLIKRFNSLILSPYNTRIKFVRLLNNEIRNAEKGLPAWATIKLNNLNDPELIKKMYEASSAGVKINLIIRGICSLVPGLKGLSENIKVISIIDRYLEHARIFAFCNGGNELYFIGSADWLVRNLDKRVEVTTPIFDKRLIHQLKRFLEIQLSDNVKARFIDEKGSNKHVPTVGKKIRSQLELHDFFNQLLKE